MILAAGAAIAVLLAAPAPAPTRGYFLSVEVIGPTEAVYAYVQRISDLEPSSLATPETLPGRGCGHVAALDDALRWVARHAFESGAATMPASDALQLGEAPPPGGEQAFGEGVRALAWHVTGARPDGSTRPISWPSDPSVGLDPDLGLKPATLTASFAPLFAAPAPEIPAASRRHGMCDARGSVWILSELDRCSSAAPPTCTRFARVVCRSGDRFQAGYLPRFQVVSHDDWSPGPGRFPAAALLRAGLLGTDAMFLLVVRTLDGQLHRKTLRLPRSAAGFPALALEVERATARVRGNEGFAADFPIVPSLDRFPRAEEDARARARSGG
jgi:hypothetical protein